ncbi:N-formylglutamate amidohydrolase [Devosia riboflavina]|uniref:N-formylglutamate amidohydrolase n=2 Tax=Devosia riboflavina TaxID=46914 RepID=A0A087M2Z5_9HYPH|nr:N-formylglutamate amidohydrolase [Devosia riboflavina]
METSVDFSENLDQGELWALRVAASPLVGTAIHDGHAVWPRLSQIMALDEAQRLREEDPFTAEFVKDIPTSIVVRRSRFEVDLNRAPEGAIYLRPEQAWGLDVWKRKPDEEHVAQLLRQHARYYALLRHVLGEIAAQFGAFVVLDMHSYNHRRNGPGGPATPQDDAPDINIGTFSMDRARWAHILDPFMACLRQATVKGRPLDVRENIAFAGKGEQTRFIHEHFPQAGCAIAVEFKKIFMDEWTGVPDMEAIADLRRAVAMSLPVLQAALLGRP